MFNDRIARALRVPALCLAGALGAAAGGAAAETPSSLIDVAAVQLAAQSDVFGAASANLQVVPMHMAGSCPRTYMLQVSLGAFSPGALSYRIETLDGRVSQVFKARSEAQPDGGFAAKAEHAVQLAEDEEGEPDPTRLVFSAPAQPEAAAEDTQRDGEPGFFERLFGGNDAEAGDPSKGLRQQRFRVRIVAPNEMASAFDGVSTSCAPEDLQRIVSSDENQRDDGGRDRGDRGRDTGRDSGRDSGAGSAGGASAGAID